MGNIYLAILLGFVCVGALVFGLSDMQPAHTKKRIAAIKTGGGAVPQSRADMEQRRAAMQAALKELEKEQADPKGRPSLRRRIEQAGLAITPRTYWLASAVAAVVGVLITLFFVRSWIAVVLAAFACGFGLARWVLAFITKRRQTAFTREFAPAMDAIVRSVKSGLPVMEALKLVATEIPQPVGGEFQLLTDGLKVGLTMEQGIKRMYTRMPTAEVNFFGIVMAMQSKAGGNLSEALSNLSGVLRDRKRLKDKIKAMSSEAKAGAMIIGSMPPGVMGIVWLTTPDYMKPMFTTELGNALLLGCAVWMGMGIFVMKKMIALKY